jgi:hypothetical protein
MAITTPTLITFAYDLLYALRPRFGSVRVDKTWPTGRSVWAGIYAEQWGEAKDPKLSGHPRKRIWALQRVDTHGCPIA